jgi:hypothetical protein
VKYDPEDDEKRAQAVKQERLRTAETLQMQGQTDVTEGEYILRSNVDLLRSTYPALRLTKKSRLYRFNHCKDHQ